MLGVAASQIGMALGLLTRATGAAAAVVNVMDFLQATTQIGQTTLRNVLGQSDLDELLSQWDRINRELQAIIDEHTERWGVKVTGHRDQGH